MVFLWLIKLLFVTLFGAVVPAARHPVSGGFDGAAGIRGLLEILEVRGSASTRSLPIYDGVGNVVGLVDATSGARVATYQYGPFGETLGIFAKAVGVSLWEAFSFGAASRAGEVGDLYDSGKLSLGQALGAGSLEVARSSAEAAVTFVPAVRLGRAARMGQVLIDRSLPLGRALLRGAATGTVAGGVWGTANVLADRGVAAVEGQAYGGALSSDVRSIGVNSLVGGVGGSLLGPVFGRLRVPLAAKGAVNLDSGTARALVGEGSPIRHTIKNALAGREMIMTQTALAEFQNAVTRLSICDKISRCMVWDEPPKVCESFEAGAKAGFGATLPPGPQPPRAPARPRGAPQRPRLHA